MFQRNLLLVCCCVGCVCCVDRQTTKADAVDGSELSEEKRTFFIEDIRFNEKKDTKFDKIIKVTTFPLLVASYAVLLPVVIVAAVTTGELL